MSKVRQDAMIFKQECIATDIFSMWIETSIAKEARPGQFIAVYSKDSSKLLPRPISICEIGPAGLRIVYRIAGEGTKEFSSYKAGDTISVMGPLGNGFPLSDEDAIIIGGGIGIPPMLELSKALNCKKEIVLGYKDELFLDEMFRELGNVSIATDTGSHGVKGTVIDAIKENSVKGKVIYACGPKPMLAAVKKYAAENGIKAWISMEERMACGIGACLGCVCKTTEIDGHSKVHNARVCADGPVFLAEEVEL